MSKILHSRPFQAACFIGLCIAISPLNKKIRDLALGQIWPLLLHYCPMRTSPELTLSSRAISQIVSPEETFLNTLEDWVNSAPHCELGDRTYIKEAILRKLRCSSGELSLNHLTSLSLYCCQRLTSLPNLNSLTHLTSLSLYHCQTPISLPDLRPLTKLISLHLSDCQSLISLPDLRLLTSLTSLTLFDCNRLTSLPGLKILTKLTSLALANCQNLTPLPDLRPLTNLTSLTLSNYQRITPLPDLRPLTNLTSLTLSFFQRLTSLPDLRPLTNLTSLDLSCCEALTSSPDLDLLTNLASLSLYHCQSLTSLPDLRHLTNLISLDLFNCTSLRSLPSSITQMPRTLTINLENTRLSDAILWRLEEIIYARNYNGPTINLPMTHYHEPLPEKPFAAILAEVLVKAEETAQDFPNLLQFEKNLTPWLKRLNSTAEGGVRNSIYNPQFYKTIVKNLRLANENPEFRTHFGTILEDASTTCGDRVALSILRMGLLRNATVAFEGGDLKVILKTIKDCWAIELLEFCAKEKVKTLRFVDEIEVYLGYPIQLKDRLGLSLDISDMLYFGCSGLTQADLEAAFSFVKDHLDNHEALADRLLGDDSWRAALNKKHPEATDSEDLVAEYRRLTIAFLS